VIDKRSFDEQGYVVARRLFDADEATFWRDHFMRLREAGAHPGDVVGVDPKADDPLKRYPRMIHMHRWDQVALDWLLEPRLARSLTTLLGVEPFAVQTMLYFKPPGARGQAPHQDQYYLRVKPGTCIAAWMALDPCDEENGCLEVVSGSQAWPVLCTIPADTTQSFTDVTVPFRTTRSSSPWSWSPAMFSSSTARSSTEASRTGATAFAGHWSATTSRVTLASVHSGITLRFGWTAARWSSSKGSAGVRAASGSSATAGPRSS
jgi:hypothetical protein